MSMEPCFDCKVEYSGPDDLAAHWVIPCQLHASVSTLLEVLEDWESSTNHHVTRLSPSGRVTKEKARAAIRAAKGGS